MDLLESIEDEILNTLEEDMIQFEKENSISQLMNSIIFYISEHKQLVRLLFSDHGDPGFLNKLLLAPQHWTMPMWQRRRPGCDPTVEHRGISGVRRGSFFFVGEIVCFYFGWIFAREINKMDFHNTYCYYNHRFFHLKMNYKLWSMHQLLINYKFI